MRGICHIERPICRGWGVHAVITYDATSRRLRWRQLAASKNRRSPRWRSYEDRAEGTYLADSDFGPAFIIERA